MRVVAVPGSNWAPIAGAKAIGPADPNERLEVSVILREKAPDALAAHLQSASPGQYMSREQFARTCGTSAADMAAVSAFAQQHGLAVVQQDAARRTIVLSGTVAQVNAAFSVQLQTFAHDGGTYRGRAGAVHVPADLSGIVVAVLGTDNRPVAQPRFRVYAPPGNVRWHTPPGGHRGKRRPTPPPVPAPPPAAPPVIAGPTSYSPLDVAALYGFPPATGAGQCIGIIELGGGFRGADLQTYFANLGLATPNIIAVSVDHGANTPTGASNGPDGEVMLDIEIAAAIAPAATVAVYFAPNTSAGFLDAITTAVHDTTNKPSVISISWGGPETGFSQQSLAAFDAAFQSAAALGVTICCAAGDSGSSDGIPDGTDHVDFPASSPNVLACGGTSLRGANGAIASEQVWNDGPGHGSGGGGVSTIFPLPAWQNGLAATKSTGAAAPLAMRGVPDVAGNADPRTGYSVLVDGSIVTVGGTSAVAPLWAGLIARLNQISGTQAGFINPLLYRHAQSLRDITAGDNGDFEATTGWDACTGLGSPNGAALAAILRPPPAS